MTAINEAATGPVAAEIITGFLHWAEEEGWCLGREVSAASFGADHWTQTASEAQLNLLLARYLEGPGKPVHAPR